MVRYQWIMPSRTSSRKLQSFKRLWDVNYHNSIDDARDFIKSANSDFISFRALYHAIKCKHKVQNEVIVGIMSKKNIDTTYNKEDLARDQKNLTGGKVKIM
jgi:hypothetical protein